MATENALELARLGHFTEPEHAPYKVAHPMPIARLRRYGVDGRRRAVSAPLVLIPPLMVTAEIYDVAPDISGVTALTEFIESTRPARIKVSRKRILGVPSAVGSEAN